MANIPISAVESWVFEDALPFWAEHGIDREYGGFLEEVSAAGEVTDCSFKRVRTMCRQTYVFSHAALLGFAPGAALSTLGYEYLDSHARLKGGCWARVLGRRGEILDDAADLYDLTFVLFALAWRYRLTGEAAVLSRLLETQEFCWSRMRTDEGFLSSFPDTGERLQNPHMHLAEASLVAFAATENELFLDQARQLVRLLKTRLFNGANLGERFDASWTRHGEQALEPGHHFEWAWILGQYRQATGEDIANEAGGLVGFAERVGVHPSSQAVFDAVDETGRVLKPTSRAWTNTERIKGWLSLHEMGCADGVAPIAGSLDLLFKRYFKNPKRGLWIDQFDLEGRAITANVPASTVYHLLLAFSEILRLRMQLTPDELI